jgi:hypothetical protein
VCCAHLAFAALRASSLRFGHDTNRLASCKSGKSRYVWKKRVAQKASNVIGSKCEQMREAAQSGLLLWKKSRSARGTCPRGVNGSIILPDRKRSSNGSKKERVSLGQRLPPGPSGRRSEEKTISFRKRQRTS